MVLHPASIVYMADYILPLFITWHITSCLYSLQVSLHPASIDYMCITCSRIHYMLPNPLHDPESITCLSTFRVFRARRRPGLPSRPGISTGNFITSRCLGRSWRALRGNGMQNMDLGAEQLVYTEAGQAQVAAAVFAGLCFGLLGMLVALVYRGLQRDEAEREAHRFEKHMRELANEPEPSGIGFVSLPVGAA